MARPEKHIFVCLNQRPLENPKGSCTTRGAEEVFKQFKHEIELNNLYGKVFLTKTGCLGPCQHGAIVLVYPDAIWYAGVTKNDVPKIIQQHIIGNKPVEHLLLAESFFDRSKSDVDNRKKPE